MNESNNNKDGFIKYVLDWVNNYPGRAVGIIFAFLVGILLFTLGIFKTIVVVLLVVVGYFLGKSRDDNIPVIDQLSNLFKKKDE